MMRFMVPLSGDLRTELWELAQLEQRDMRDQAVVLIKEALEARKTQPQSFKQIRLFIDIIDDHIVIKPELDKNGPER